MLALSQVPVQPGVAVRLFKALSAGGVNIELMATSEIRTSCVVAETDGTASPLKT